MGSYDPNLGFYPLRNFLEQQPNMAIFHWGLSPLKSGQILWESFASPIVFSESKIPLMMRYVLNRMKN